MVLINCGLVDLADFTICKIFTSCSVSICSNMAAATQYKPVRVVPSLKINLLIEELILAYVSYYL